MMKSSQGAMPATDLSHAEAEVAMKIRGLFVRCPELAGFAVLDMDGWLAQSADHEASDADAVLVVTDVGLTTRVSREQIDEVYDLIATAISDVLCERPEAFELLRGHTFARTLH